MIQPPHVDGTQTAFMNLGAQGVGTAHIDAAFGKVPQLPVSIRAEIPSKQDRQPVEIGTDHKQHPSPTNELSPIAQKSLRFRLQMQ